MTEDQIAETILAAINAPLYPKVAYDVDKVPAKPADEYVTATLSRRYLDTRLASGEVTLTGWRLTTRYVSKKSVTNARVMREKVREAIEERLLPIGGDFLGPVDFETAQPIGADDGWFSGSDGWTF